MRLVRLAFQVTATGAALALSGAASAHAQAGPPPIRSASLAQQGQDLVWNVRLAHAFWPSRMAHAHFSLCLLIEWKSGRTRANACVTPTRHGHPPRLVVNHRTIAATVTRPATDSLTASFLPSAVGMRYTRLRWQACLEQTGQCATPVPARAPTLKLHVPRLVGCVASGAPYVTHGPSAGREVALTFDDGPWYDTPQFLDVLEREHVHATFFQIGEQIARYGSVDRRILRDGDMIGDHTWNHANVAGGGSFAAGEISQTAAAIRGATGGFNPCLFRAPGGAVSPALISEARSMHFTTIEWDVDPVDWSTPGTGVIYSRVVSNTHAGSIVLQHDGGGNRSETLAALPHEIDTLRHEGFHFVTVTQLLGYRLLYK